MYKVNPSAYDGVFVLPAAVTDRFIKLAPEGFIKVLLYLFRHCDTAVSPEDTAAGTGVSPEEARDALAYWEQQGLLLTGEDLPVLQKTDNQTDTKAQTPPPPAVSLPVEETKDYTPLKHRKPSYNDICIRIKESSDVRELLNAAQGWLGRTVSIGDQADLLDLYDYYGLPVALIMSICEYAKTHNKGTNMNYIHTVGVDWSRRGIDTLEAADEEFKKLENLNTVWAQFCKLTGLRREVPTQVQQRYIDVWTYEWHFSVPVLHKAYEEMSRYAEKSGFPYMNKILANWHQNGIKTPEDAAAFQEEYRKKQDEKLLKKTKRNGISENAAKQAPASAPSYDIDKATQIANASVPQLKKKH